MHQQQNQRKKDMQLWFVSNIDRMEIEITETRRMNVVSCVELFQCESLTTTSLLTPWDWASDAIIQLNS